MQQQVIALGTILIADDEPGLVEMLTTYLADEGFAVLSALDGIAAVEMALGERPDLLILDLNLPRLSGIEAFRRIRAKFDMPVIMLTARNSEVDRVVGLELGADDYVSKPFSPREVVARVKTVLRRYRHGWDDPAQRRSDHEIQRIGALEIDRTAHEVRRNGHDVRLTPTEYRILDVLAHGIGRAFTREQILERVSIDSPVFDRTLDRHIANIRVKIENAPGHPRLVRTVLGVGYKMMDAL